MRAYILNAWMMCFLLMQLLGSLFALQVAVKVYAFDTLINPLDNKTELVYYNARNGYKELALLNARNFDILAERRQYSVKMWNQTKNTRMHTRRRESHDSLWRWFKRPGEMWRQWVTVLCFWLVCDLVIKLSVSWRNDQGGWCSGTALTYKSIIKEPCPYFWKLLDMIA